MSISEISDLFNISASGAQRCRPQIGSSAGAPPWLMARVHQGRHRNNEKMRNVFVYIYIYIYTYNYICIYIIIYIYIWLLIKIPLSGTAILRE